METVARLTPRTGPREAASAAAALEEHAEAIREREFARLLRQLPNLSEAERNSLRGMSCALVTGLLRDPKAALQGDCHPLHARMARELFAL
jgi:glutamyl-tRNA reductase